VYDTGAARSGEPVFTKLTCSLNLGFVYSLAGDQLENISGTQQVDATVLDQQSGWKRTLPLISTTQFYGNSYTSKATLDLCQVQALVAAVEQKTGLRLSNYTLDIVAHISVGGKISGQDFSDSFAPHLTFNFDSLHFYMAGDSSKTDPMHTEQDGLFSSASQVENTLQVFGLKPSVRVVRTVAVVGLVLSQGILLALGIYFYKTFKRSPEAVIGLKYGALLMEIHDQGLETFSPAIEVTTMDDLAKLAERQGALIMHLTREDGQYYFVQTEGATYRYVAGKAQPAAPDAGQAGIAMAAAEKDGKDPT
jgi:hypothetical protein